MDLSCFRLPKCKKGKRPSPPTGAIAEAFKEYINNEIPVRLIDTSKLRFVSRRDVFRVFQDEIANITEELIRERMERTQSDPFASYQPRRESVIRQIIQEIVKYDVLSHRRDEITGEPSYQDICTGKHHAPKFRKLVQFCKTSRNLGRKLAWMDTCCVDYTNTVELSESVNAMYKWYANSYLCIVYLAECSLLADWDHESWFQRGWTLQELLAPKRVRFYNRDWRPFILAGIDDDRQCDIVIPCLETITSISRAVLTADNTQGIQGHTFWEIISWASNRQTAHIEDMAYSLVGFFYISLTVTYGEGHRAFSNLIEAVATKDRSWDVFAWRGKSSMDHFALPLSPSSYPAFEADIGRDRVGIRDFTITACGLSLRSLPPIPMEVCSVTDPERPGMPFLVNLKPRSDIDSSLGKYGNLIVECGITRLGIIRGAKQLSACVLNHHGARSREKGKLMVGMDYICFLLYSDDEEADDAAGVTWMKLATNNLLRITCMAVPETAIREQHGARPDAFDLPLTTTFVQPPKALT